MKDLKNSFYRGKVSFFVGEILFSLNQITRFLIWFNLFGQILVYTSSFL